MAWAEGSAAVLITPLSTLKPFRCQANSEAGTREKTLPSKAIWAMLCSAGPCLVFHRNPVSFQESFQTDRKEMLNACAALFQIRVRMSDMSGMKGASTGGRTLFTLVLEPGAASPRKKSAPAARAHADKRRKAPRFRQDYSAETAE